MAIVIACHGEFMAPIAKGHYLMNEFDCLKSEEVKQQSLEWNLQRALSKINYRIHTDVIAV